MKLDEYFSAARGTGVLATADASGRVDAAIYARPHLMDDGTLAFIMRDRLTYHNISENPYAAYLFMEQGGGYQGIRLFLKKNREEHDPDLIQSLTRRCLSPEEDAARGPKYLVCFDVEKALELVGGESIEAEPGPSSRD